MISLHLNDACCCDTRALSRFFRLPEAQCEHWRVILAPVQLLFVSQMISPEVLKDCELLKLLQCPARLDIPVCALEKEASLVGHSTGVAASLLALRAYPPHISQF